MRTLWLIGLLAVLGPAGASAQVQPDYLTPEEVEQARQQVLLRRGAKVGDLFGRCRALARRGCRKQLAPEAHAAALALHYFAYNFIKIHRTLRCSSADGGRRSRPAV